MSKITYLKVENILGVKDIEVELNGKSANIAGKNRQGKSSLQKALKMAACGKSYVPPEPVRRGAEEGSVLIETDTGYVVEFTAKPPRETKFVIRQKDNPRFKSEKVETLKEIFGNIWFDPGEAMALEYKKLLETLMKVAGVDFTEANAKRKKLFDERTAVGRDVKRLEGQLAGMTLHRDAPAVEEDSNALLAEIEKAQQHQLRVQGIERECARFERDLTDLDRKIAELQAQRKRTAEELDAQRQHLEQQKAGLVDVEPLKLRLNTVEETNRKVRENKHFEQVQAESKKVNGEYYQLTKQIEQIDAEKAGQLAAAILPVEGLTFDEEHIRVNGTLWADCSESERWGVATALAFSMNPQGIVFMSNSGGLDKDSRKAIRDRAEALGVQLLLEVVGDAPDGDWEFLIEGGMVVGNRLSEATL